MKENSDRFEFSVNEIESLILEISSAFGNNAKNAEKMLSQYCKTATSEEAFLFLLGEKKR